MGKQIVTDEELRSSALELQAEGGLTVRALRQKAGGDWARVSRVAREVRDQSNGAAPEVVPTEREASDEALAPAIKTDVERLERTITVELASALRSERERSRQAERAMAEQHSAELDAMRSTVTALRDHLGELEDAAGEQNAQIEAIESELAESRRALQAARDEQRVQTETCANERLALSDGLRQAQAEATANAGARREAEASVEKLRIENARISARLENADTDRQALRDKLREKEREATELTERLLEAENRAAGLLGRIQELEAARERQEARPSPATRLKATRTGSKKSRKEPKESQ